MKIGILGGTFDPVHKVHLMLAEWALEEGMDEVWFVPNYLSPFRNEVYASSEDRLEMLKIAVEQAENVQTAREVASKPGKKISKIGKNRHYKINTYELEKGQVCYTSETILALKAKNPGDEFFIILGTDTFNEFQKWKNWQDILKKAGLLVFIRPGHEVKAWHVPGYEDKVKIVEIDLWDVSSTKIRSAIKSEGKWQDFVPDPVAQYIQQKGLYI